MVVSEVDGRRFLHRLMLVVSGFMAVLIGTSGLNVTRCRYDYDQPKCQEAFEIANSQLVKRSKAMKHLNRTSQPKTCCLVEHLTFLIPRASRPSELLLRHFFA